jgi:8-oxo-dGTP diphosphatase
MEEFGVTVTEKDVTYAKLYPSVVDPTKESYFIVVELKGITVDQIRFGDEGLEYFLLTPEEYLALPDAIEFHISRIKEYLESPR